MKRIGAFLFLLLSCSPILATEKSPARPERPTQFYAVFREVLADFEYDLQKDLVSGLERLAIWNVTTSPTIPPQFKEHLVAVIREKIEKKTNTPMPECPECARVGIRVGPDGTVLPSPAEDERALQEAAERRKIKHLIEVSFSHQRSGVLLSLQVFEPKEGRVIWSKNYHSNYTRAEAKRRKEDYDQIVFARRNPEYDPTFNIRPGIYYTFGRAIGQYRSLVAFGVRLLERYDMRKKEAGIEIDYLLDALKVAGDEASTGDAAIWNIYRGHTLNLLFIHSWNLFGLVESLDVARGSLLTGVGFSYTFGQYWGYLIRAGYEWRLGRQWALTSYLQYRPPAAAYHEGASIGTVHGLELGLGVSLQLYSSGS